MTTDERLVSLQVSLEWLCCLALHAYAHHDAPPSSPQVTLEWLCRLQQQTGETNLCLVGGVVQNSVLNGRVAREAGFEHVFIPPYPGDEGIAAGCAAYALHSLLPQLGVPAPARRGIPWPAYMGRAYSAAEVQAAMDEFSPWIEEVTLAQAPRTAPDAQTIVSLALHPRCVPPKGSAAEAAVSALADLKQLARLEDTLGFGASRSLESAVAALHNLAAIEHRIVTTVLPEIQRSDARTRMKQGHFTKLLIYIYIVS